MQLRAAQIIHPTIIIWQSLPSTHVPKASLFRNTRYLCKGVMQYAIPNTLCSGKKMCTADGGILHMWCEWSDHFLCIGAKLQIFCNTSNVYTPVMQNLGYFCKKHEGGDWECLHFAHMLMKPFPEELKYLPWLFLKAWSTHPLPFNIF